MTIYIDSAAGSSALLSLPPLAGFAQSCQLPIPPAPLAESRADVMFEANGPDGSTLLFGFEVAKLTELITKIETGRLQGTQLPGLLAIYDMQWLVVIEGDHRPNPDTGIFQVRRKINDTWQWIDWKPKNRQRTFSWSYPFNFLASPEFLRLGVHLIMLPNESTVAHWLFNTYHLWQKPYNGHKSMRTLDRSGVGLPTSTSSGPFAGLPDPRMRDPRFAQRVATAASLPEIRFERALAMAEAFPTVQKMINPACTCGGGDVEDDERAWAEVKTNGRRVGKSIAKKIAEVVR